MAKIIINNKIQEYPLIKRLHEETRILYENKIFLSFIFLASALAELILREKVGSENGTYGSLISSVSPEQECRFFLDTHKQIKEIRNKYFHITAGRVSEFNGLAIVDKENEVTFLSELDVADSFEISISEDAQNIYKLLSFLIEKF